MATEESWNGKNMYCYRCGHCWMVRNDKKPRMCPRCRSSRYDVPVAREHVCAFCGKGWTLESLDDVCPACGKHIFDSGDPEERHCNQCDHVWIARSKRDPVRCPLCKSKKWKAPRNPQYICRRCGNVWMNSTGAPKKCPKCQSLKWNEPAFKLQCRRCGYKWIANNSEGSDKVKACPSCRSRKWNEVPTMASCPQCGSIYVPRTPGAKCPKCSSAGSGKPVIDQQCGFCGETWSTTQSMPVCPRCGMSKPIGEDDRQVVLWEGDRYKLTYLHKDGIGCVYLWADGLPEAVSYIEEIMRRSGTPLKQLVSMAGDPSHEGYWRELAAHMLQHKDDCMGNVPYFKQRLGLSQGLAEILALHFVGMCPEAIALLRGETIESVRLAFDAIMRSYSDSGIVVNDSIFTDDPISLYGDPEERRTIWL
ncbi:MAG: hypothetical protein IKQ60_07215 [Candidatus Methanomethylophilaceae archaeon]|nr:hypothetical protein [Candidatus Methanomethylophilaceae archaeon]